MKSEEVSAVEFASRPAPDQTYRVLVLGGTSEASQFAAHLSGRPDLTVLSSLAGRVSQPTMPAGIVRVGGFGGVPGLVEYLATQRIDVVIDATHPFAAKITRNAELACEQTRVPLIAFERPAWLPQQGDRWLQVPEVASAGPLVDHSPNRVLLSVGRQELAGFSDCRNAWFLVRAIDKPTVPLPPNSRLILSRGPFPLEEERLLLRREAITHIVSKNSGGAATYAKIEAARELGIEVVMVDRPVTARTAACTQVDEVYLRLEELLATHSDLQLNPTETRPL